MTRRSGRWPAVWCLVLLVLAGCSGGKVAATSGPAPTSSIVTTTTTEPDWSTTPSSDHHPDTTASTTASDTTETPVSAGDRGVFPVQVGDLWGLIDRSGAWIVQPQFEYGPHFVDGLAVARVVGPDGNAKAGYIDKTGAWVIEPKFEQAREFSESLAPAAVRTADNRVFWGYIDKAGAWVIQPRFADAWPFSYGLAAVQAHPEVEKSDKYGYIDKTGAWVIEPHWDHGDAFQVAGRIALVQTGNRMGYIDRTGKVLVSPHYNLAQAFSEGLAGVRVRVDSKTEIYGYIDIQAKEVIKPQYWDAQPFSNGLGLVTVLGKGDGFIDRTGKPAIDRWFERAYSFSDGKAAVLERDSADRAHLGYIDTSGQMVIAPQFDVADEFHAGIAVAGFYTNVPVDSGLDEARFGYINDRGGWIIEPRFSYAEPFVDGLAWVREGDREGYVDIEGKWVFSQPYERPEGQGVM